MIEELKKKKKEENSILKLKFEKIMEKRKKIEEEKNSKIKQKQIKENKKRKKYLYFLNTEKEKSIEENKDFSRKQKLIQKLREEEKLLMKPVTRTPFPEYFKSTKKNIEFEQNLNSSIKKLLKQEDIQKIFNDYEPHLKLILNIYSKIDSNNLVLYSKDILNEEGFKQFLINFTILGLLVSTEQMNWIYNIITKETLEKRENQSYFDYHDFQMALCYLSIFARFTDRSRKITQNDIDNTNGQYMENFFNYMGLTLPFYKKELEKYIYDRRSMTTKELLK